MPHFFCSFSVPIFLFPEIVKSNSNEQCSAMTLMLCQCCRSSCAQLTFRILLWQPFKGFQAMVEQSLNGAITIGLCKILSQASVRFFSLRRQAPSLLPPLFSTRRAH